MLRAASDLKRDREPRSILCEVQVRLPLDAWLDSTPEKSVAATISRRRLIRAALSGFSAVSNRPGGDCAAGFGVRALPQAVDVFAAEGPEQAGVDEELAEGGGDQAAEDDGGDGVE